MKQKSKSAILFAECEKALVDGADEELQLLNLITGLSRELSLVTKS